MVNTASLSDHFDIMEDQPLFPLSMPLFPCMRIDLQIFEQRYLKMIRACLRNDSSFVICPLRPNMGKLARNTETSQSAAFYDVGVRTEIVDWSSLDNGLLGITCEGVQKVEILDSWSQSDGLFVGNITPLKDELEVSVPDWAQDLLSIYGQLLKHPELMRRLPDQNELNASLLGWSLAQVLPINDDQRVGHLRETDPIMRLKVLSEQISKLQ